MQEDKEIILQNLEINPLLQKLRNPPTAKNCKNEFFTSFDGTQIFYRMWLPPKKLEKIIIVAHGMGGHSEFFVLLADKVVDHGIMVIAPDYRNHGYSEGKKGDLKKFKYILRDFHHFIDLIKEKYQEIPIFLFGESMGGTVLINYAKQSPNDFSNLSGLILFSPGVKIKLSRKSWVLISIILLPLMLFRLLFPSKRIISTKGREEGIRNPIHQQYDKTEPLHLEKVSLRYLFQVFKHIRKTMKIAPMISIPSIIFQGGKDSGISPEGVKKFYSKLASKDKKMILIEEGSHALLTDPSFQDKWEAVINWIKNH